MWFCYSIRVLPAARGQRGGHDAPQIVGDTRDPAPCLSCGRDSDGVLLVFRSQKCPHCVQHKQWSNANVIHMAAPNTVYMYTHTHTDGRANRHHTPDLLLLFDIQAFGDPGDTGASEGGFGQTTIARAGRAARAGTRAARIVRVFKALTLIKKSKNQGGKPESYVGQLVNDGIQRKIIIIVATMLVVSEVLLMIEDEEQFKRTTTDLRTELVSFQLLLQIAGGNVRAEPFASNMVGRT